MSMRVRVFGVADGGLRLVQQEGGDGGTNPCTGLTISPGPQTITVTGISPLVTVPGSLAYTAKLSPMTCAKGNVTAAWSVSNEDIAAVGSDGTLKLYVPVATNMTVTAYAGSWVATTTATVVVSVQDKSMVPAATAAIFDGTARGQRHRHRPLSLRQHGVSARGQGAACCNGTTPAPRRPRSNTSFAIRPPVRRPSAGRASSPNRPRRAQSFPQAMWSALDQTAKGADALIGIQRVVGGQLLPEITRPVHFSIAPLRGQIYYTEYGRKGINPPPALGSGCGFGQQRKPHPIARPHRLERAGESLPDRRSGRMPGVSLGGRERSHVRDLQPRVGSGRRCLAHQQRRDLHADRRFSAAAEDRAPTRAVSPGRPSRPTVSTFCKARTSGETPTKPVIAGVARGSRAAMATGSTPTISRTPRSWEPPRNTASTPRSTSRGARARPIRGPGGGFSARWTGQVQPYTTETFTFEVESSDGARLWVDNQLIIDTWTNHNPAVKTTGTFAGTKGQKYDIKLEYYESTGAAVAKLRWSSPQNAIEIIPETQLYAR